MYQNQEETQSRLDRLAAMVETTRSGANIAWPSKGARRWSATLANEIDTGISEGLNVAEESGDADSVATSNPVSMGLRRCPAWGAGSIPDD